MLFDQSGAPEGKRQLIAEMEEYGTLVAGSPGGSSPQAQGEAVLRAYDVALADRR